MTGFRATLQMTDETWQMNFFVQRTRRLRLVDTLFMLRDHGAMSLVTCWYMGYVETSQRNVTCDLLIHCSCWEIMGQCLLWLVNKCTCITYAYLSRWQLALDWLIKEYLHQHIIREKCLHFTVVKYTTTQQNDLLWACLWLRPCSLCVQNHEWTATNLFHFGNNQLIFLR